MTPWWRSVFVDGLGPAVVAGLFAVVVARLTVHWTLARQRDQTRRGQSENAAATLAEYLVDLSQRLVLTKPGIEPDYHEWWRQSTLLAHQLQCQTLRARILYLNVKLRDYIAWHVQLTTDVRNHAARWSIEGWHRIRADYIAALNRTIADVLAGLQAHSRGDEPELPVVPEFPDLPELIDTARNPE